MFEKSSIPSVLGAPKVSVYMPVHNYEAYVCEAVESVIRQTYTNWELLIINDGSTDSSREKISLYADHPKIKIIDQVNRGLTVTNNIALRSVQGELVMRLDADDTLEENALLVMATTLATKPDVGLVYPDYYETDAEGSTLRLVRRKKIGVEDQVYDLPAHGACTMFRRDVLVQLGGYDESESRQDGYDIWVRFLRHFRPHNVNIPLFYYRKHGNSLSDNNHKILAARRAIIRREAEGLDGGQTNVLGIIPVAEQKPTECSSAFYALNGKNLIDYTLEEVAKSANLTRSVVATSDERVKEYVREKYEVSVYDRPEYLRGTRPGILREVSAAVMNEYSRQKDTEYQAYCILPINAPLRKYFHVDWAINTLKVFGFDEVIAVEEELSEIYRHRTNGLEPVTTEGELKLEKDAVYRSNGALQLVDNRSQKVRGKLEKKIGHILMLREESIRVVDTFDHWLVSALMNRGLSREYEIKEHLS